VHAPDHGGLIAHLAGAVPGARPIGGAAIPRHTHNANIKIISILERDMRQAKERRNTAKAWRDQT
jgi:hypothetical protein